MLSWASVGGIAQSASFWSRPVGLDQGTLSNNQLASQPASHSVGRPIHQGEKKRTLEGFRNGPEVRAAVDVPLDMARRLGRKTLEAVGGMLNVQLVACFVSVGVRVLLVRRAKEAGDALLKLAEDVHLEVGVWWAKQEGSKNRTRKAEGGCLAPGGKEARKAKRERRKVSQSKPL